MKILVAGDFCPQARVQQLVDAREFQTVLGDIKKVVSKADYSIVNLECPVCFGEELPIVKCGPTLKGTDRGIEALKWAGFDCVTLANNHFFDYGDDGVKNSLNKCKELGIDTVGGGMNLQEASAILYKEIDQKLLAVINCCEHEFSIATNAHGGSNPLNLVKIYYAIKEAKGKADYVLVITHGGHEHYQLPSTRMQEAYRFFIDTGADAVVNHHQHCYSGYEIYSGRPIVYGLGNFCFDEGFKNEPLWHEGYMVIIDFDKQYALTLFPYLQCAETPSVSLLKNRKCFDSNIDRLNIIINDPDKLISEQKRYYENYLFSYKALLDPFSIRHVRAFQRRGWLPLFYSKKKLLQYINYISCESHRDKLLFALTHNNKNEKESIDE